LTSTRTPASPRVCHVSPTYFAPESVLGGGERFAEELALAMARRADVADVKFVSFGRRALRERVCPSYERVILKSWSRSLMTPFSPALWSELADADVVHCYQYFVLPTFLAALAGYLRGARVFVSDLGGGAWTPGYQIDQSRWITAHLPISRYAARGLPGDRPFRVIYGGVDLARYPRRPPAPDHDGSVVFLGRILPHKGLHFLIEGLPAHLVLHVLGTPGDEAYLARLRDLGAGKDIRFHLGLSDAEVLPYLRRAMALVHPTPVDERGSAGCNELFGLALIEAMACGCPVVASNVASLPEIVAADAADAADAAGENGLLVLPNDPAAIGRALLKLQADGALWRRLSSAARATVESRFTWDRVAERCLAAYAGQGLSRERIR
jgi:glycosyltransferase involved in cell wall biosynthesis